MKKILTIVLLFSLITLFISGCGAKQISQSQTEDTSKITIKVGATPVPHAQILNVVKPILAKEGINLEIVEFTDYVQPNLKLAEKELDANYFQHIPYLEDFSKEHNLNLTYIAKVHIEPMGIYSQKIKNLSELKEGATIAIPNDATNGGRALLLLQSAGVIKLKPDAGIKATVSDIVENPKKIKISELEAATLPRVLSDVDAAVINTNYALEAGLIPTKDALFIESADSPYVNVLVVRKGDESRPELMKLAEALNSPEVKKFIEEKYKGAVVPAF
ncbi:lipoprotein, YaeC family [Thermoanaerobacter mathranii subsp. mathranii str. A3]|uniref:Lipoprotein n=1 Tax=Thermoanaerobacter mathranii subsp. mathranii (strain DSM 11426 / CCUG 53645 / CIP 108742 / A3) TaxID=583358 RepID=A0ABM5LQJ5_THEM3|nr:MetQ/NlpA family ABC transporter substrate-binding protein [Thermoanaerobacter mathranii]ADH61091.1 lipoprotein, YaeC family [Thermoanaerobacter mathranii subsp. mathranii str. A3]